MSPLLKCVELTKRFPGVVANDRVTFDLMPGEVHCLFGENGAGKSTLSSCLFGYYQPEGGHIECDGIPVKFNSPRDAIAVGIGMVHQHFVLVADFTVLENIVVGTHAKGWKLDLKSARARVDALCQQYDINLDLDAYVRDLAVGQQQWVEILKALYLDARILILDEPTAVLTPDESERLFHIIDQMCQRHISIILISHKMSEVMQADRVTVLRKGAVVGTVETADATPDILTKMMVGRDVALRVSRTNPADQGDVKKPVLEVRNVSYVAASGKSALTDITLTIHSGEILGLAGVSGNGQKELFEVLSGILVPNAGEITLDGAPVTGMHSRDYMQRGVGLIPDDRFREGLIPEFSVQENLILGWQRDDAYTSGPLLSAAKIKENGEAMIDAFQIKVPSGATPVNHLSGGNAQKVILAREFSQPSTLLLANQPTRGLDLGVIEYVYSQIIAKRDQGYAVLLASEELEDLLNISDRIVVMSDGKIVGIVNAQDSSVPEIGQLMTGAQAA